MRDRLCRLLRAQPHELGALAAAFAYFFLLLAAYYVLRPVRDALAVQAGAARLPWVFTAVFAAMLALVPLWGWVCARFARAPLLAATYAFFALDLCAFWLALRGGAGPLLAGGFFVWVSVFNLFAVSVFWSFMADLFDRAQAARLFPAIAAGGSCGAIAGPAFTAQAAPALGPANLLVVSATLLAAAIGCILALARWARRHPRAGEPAAETPLGGAILAGARAALTSPFLLGISGWLLCYTVLSTALYFQQVQIVGAAIADPAERTRLFATVDLAVNALALLVQLGATARLTLRLGTGWMLALMPLLSLFGFALLGAAPVLAVLVAFGIARRVGEFAISKPVREALYTGVSREARYKAKNFIDTVVYRGGDALAGWLVQALRALGLGVSGIAFAMLPVAAAWVAVSFWLGRREARAQA
ncbi:MAG: MFS transporter [Burkholderiales bacterium]|nr:MFS transporter [Burkholderiales bacterium]